MVVYSIPHPYIFVQPVRHEKRGIAILLIAFLMLHCPVTVVQRYRDGVCGLLFHLFFIICHPYIPLRLLYTKPDLLVQLSLSEYSPSLGESLFRTRAPNSASSFYTSLLNSVVRGLQKPHISILLRTGSSVKSQGQVQVSLPVSFLNSQHCFIDCTSEPFLQLCRSLPPIFQTYANPRS